MADLTSVGVTSGVPSSGTGTVATINQLTIVGCPISNGSTSAPAIAAITGAASSATSSMSGVVVSISPNSVNANGQALMAASAPVTIASNQTAVSVLIASSSPAKNFLWQISAASSGLLVAATTVMSSELVSLASSTATVSANTYGSSNTGQAIWSDVYLTFGTTATTLAGANYAGWWLPSLDGGTTFESTASLPMARPPDFVIPAPVGTLGSSLTYKSAGLVRLPAVPFKVVAQNNLGIVTGSSSGSGFPLLRIAPYAEQY
jgi:hypothetical protein